MKKSVLALSLVALLTTPGFAQTAASVQLDQAIASAEATTSQLKSLKASGALNQQPANPSPGSVGYDARNIVNIYPKQYRKGTVNMIYPGAIKSSWSKSGALKCVQSSCTYSPTTAMAERLIFERSDGTGIDLYDVFVF